MSRGSFFLQLIGALLLIGQLIGRGAENVMSVWAEFGPLLEKLLGKEISVARDDW